MERCTSRGAAFASQGLQNILDFCEICIDGFVSVILNYNVFDDDM